MIPSYIKADIRDFAWMAYKPGHPHAYADTQAMNLPELPWNKTGIPVVVPSGREKRKDRKWKLP